MKLNIYLKKNLKKGIGFTILCTALILQSCWNVESDFEKLQKEQDGVIQNFLKTHQLDAEKSAEGWYILPIKENPDGEAVEHGSIINVYYTLRDLNGKVIDSLEAGQEVEPLKVLHVNGGLVPLSANIMLSKMRKGERYRMIIPSYAEAVFNVPAIVAANGIVDLEIEIADVLSSEDQKEEEEALISEYVESKNIQNLDTLDDGLYYKMTEAGNGVKPKNGSSVSVHYTGRLLNDKVFDSSKDRPSFKFTLGEAQVIKGWDRGILHMSKGEKGLLIIPSHLAYSGFPRYQLNEYNGLGATIPKSIEDAKVTIPAFSILVFEVELVSF